MSFWIKNEETRSDTVKRVADLLIGSKVRIIGLHSNRDCSCKIAAPPLYGLILAGGRSSRMGQDKAALRYGSKMQSEHCAELLSGLCEQVFLSIRRDQASDPGYQEFPQLHDRYENVGPMGGILTAMQTFPDVAWLVLACDIPCVNREGLLELIKRRNPAKMATAFQRAGAGIPDPLCTIYEPQSRIPIQAALEREELSPAKLLERLDIEILLPPSDDFLRNINTPEAYRQILRGDGVDPMPAR